MTSYQIETIDGNILTGRCESIVAVQNDASVTWSICGKSNGVMCVYVEVATAYAFTDDAKIAKEAPLDYAQIIASLAFLTDEQRAGFFALLGASYCLTCGSVEGGRCACRRSE